MAAPNNGGNYPPNPAYSAGSGFYANNQGYSAGGNGGAYAGGGWFGGETPTRSNGYADFEITTPVNRWSSGPTPTTPTSATSANPSDPHILLIALAESYFEAAHSNGFRAASKGEDAKAYYKLIATGLTCLETALQWRLQPRLEVMVRLRYATILHEETDNVDEAEDALNKGILVAQRNNLVELKYTMQHLLVRLTFPLNPKASLKLLTAVISESETVDRPLWTYSLRFLRASLLTEPSLIYDPPSALITFQKISNTAAMRRDAAVYVLSNLMEAMIHLLQGADGVEAAQRALVKASALPKPNSEMGGASQLDILAQVLDMVCALMLGKQADGEVKLKTLHRMLDETARWDRWKDNGEFDMVVNPGAGRREKDILKAKWLNRDELFLLGYFLSGAVKFQKNVEESGKAEKFILEGLKGMDRISEQEQRTSCSLVGANDKLMWKRTLKCYMLLYHTFLLSIRTDWDNAIRCFKHLQETILTLPNTNTALLSLTSYLHATILHGTNSLPAALRMYSTLYPLTNDLSTLAKLNSVLILRPTNPVAGASLLQSVEKACTSSKNMLLKAAYAAVKATDTGGELVKTKNYLSMALQCATQTANQQLTFVILAFMCERFFKGVVSEQAEKSARAALQNAKKGRDNLWSLMGGEMYADCLARKGNEMDAMRQREINEEAREMVIANLTRSHEGLE